MPVSVTGTWAEGAKTILVLFERLFRADRHVRGQHGPELAAQVPAATPSVERDGPRRRRRPQRVPPQPTWNAPRRPPDELAADGLRRHGLRQPPPPPHAEARGGRRRARRGRPPGQGAARERARQRHHRGGPYPHYIRRCTMHMPICRLGGPSGNASVAGVRRASAMQGRQGAHVSAVIRARLEAQRAGQRGPAHSATSSNPPS